jgi:predicted RNA-binding Zn-ribbon protein involved in translation (DUF1610 family)
MIEHDWGYEGPDESVGIFGYMVWHEECPKSDDLNECEATDSETVIGMKFVPRDGYTMVETRTQYTCPACGAHTYVYDCDVSTLEDE